MSPSFKALIVIENCVHVSPLISNFLPVSQGCQRCDDAEGSFDILLSEQVVQKSNCLNCLPESHLISQDRVTIIMPSFDKPVGTVDLVLLESLSLLENGLFAFILLVQLIGHFIREQRDSVLEQLEVIVDIVFFDILPSLLRDSKVFHQLIYLYPGLSSACFCFRCQAWHYSFRSSREARRSFE